MREIIHIKNMVCNRCILVVEQLFKDLEIEIYDISLGRVEAERNTLSDEKRASLKRYLEDLGFELIDSHKAQIIEKIKNIIVERIHHSDEDEMPDSWSEFIASKFNYDYNYLSRLFSAKEGVTIERYIISQKTEKVKELLIYDRQTLSEIAFSMGYSSVAHLSGQFKRITGMSPSEFKEIGEKKRKPLDMV